ncbi:Tyrosine-protein kinase [Parasponia andersonii]|uniref:Tyrosine-protein kinase n=1 Tax=Parasponia andersonii TaxID=3476 RepID=A0A2P5D3G5_PARAD|nr:Tyrosine-protein kinase [Parasponia andersonii]
MGHFPLVPTGRRPDWAILMWVIYFSEPLALPESMSNEFRSFAECCLQKESSKRWSAAQLLAYPFLCNDPKII